MNVQITAHHESSTCLWCDKSRECVTADFGDGFIAKGTLCWACLQNAVKVQQRQTPAPTEPKRTQRKQPTDQATARRDADGT